MQLSRRVSNGMANAWCPLPRWAEHRSTRGHISPAGRDPGALCSLTLPLPGCGTTQVSKESRALVLGLERSGQWFLQPRRPDTRGVTGPRAVGAAAELFPQSCWEAQGPPHPPSVPDPNAAGSSPALMGTVQTQPCPNLEP